MYALRVWAELNPPLQTRVVTGCTRSGKRFAAVGLRPVEVEVEVEVDAKAAVEAEVKVEVEDDTHYTLRSSCSTTGPLWVAVPRCAGIYRLPMEMRRPMLEAERKQMARYPVKDPRMYPFTGRVPPLPDAEAKEARLEQLDTDISNMQYRLAKMMPILLMPRRHLRECIEKLEAERDALLALAESE